MNWTYEILRSSRRTLALEIRDGRLLVRAPRRATQAEIEALLEKHGAWIEKHLQRAEAQRAAAEALAPLTVEELRALAERALQVIPERVRYYAPKIGVTYGRITIRAQRTKWGSCSAQGNLNFNCLLMLAPPEVLDSIVVHELCHRREMNHSERFYAEVLRVFPDYRKWNKAHLSLVTISSIFPLIPACSIVFSPLSCIPFLFRQSHRVRAGRRPVSDAEQATLSNISRACALRNSFSSRRVSGRTGSVHLVAQFCILPSQGLKKRKGAGMMQTESKQRRCPNEKTV